MVKTQTDESNLSNLEKILLEKKRMLLNGNASNDTNENVNPKKKTNEEKDKIRKAEKKKRRKQRKQNAKNEEGLSSGGEEEAIIRSAVPKPDIDPNIEVEYVEKDEYLLTGKYYDEFKHVFQYFAAPKQPINEGHDEEEEAEGQDGEEGQQGAEEQLSRKKKKMLKRLQIAQLKAQVKRPDVVEVIQKIKIRKNS